MTTSLTTRARALRLLTTALIPTVSLLPVLAGCNSDAPNPGPALSAAPVSANGSQKETKPASPHRMSRKAMPVNPAPGDVRRGSRPPGPPDGGGDRGSDGLLQYFGGPVITNVHIYAINWGPGVSNELQSTVAPDGGADGGGGVVGGIGAFYQAVTNSPYWAWLAEYNTTGLTNINGGPGSNQIIGPGTFVSQITITPSNNSANLADTDIGNELAYQINIGAIPGPKDTLDAAGNVNALYMFDFPVSVATGTVSITLEGEPSCQPGSFCAFHSTTTITQDSVSYNVPFGVIPSMFSGACSTSCGAGTNALNNSFIVHSHELAESVTDTDVGLSFGSFGATIAWYDGQPQTAGGAANGEIADICAGQAGSVDGYAVQKLWSNANNECIDIPPLCHGTLQPPSCTPCTAADNGLGCAGSTPVCETNTSSAQFGQCVACTSTTACPAGQAAFCDTTTDVCNGCTAADCTGTTPICETSGAQSGACVACDSQNHASCTGPTPVCDPTTFTCVGCATGATCPASTPICDVNSQTCRACAGASDCSKGTVCDTTSGSATLGQCVGCATNSDCANPTPTCTDTKCVACATAKDCSGGSTCQSGSCMPSGGGSDAGTDSGSKSVDGGAAKGGSSGGCSCRTAPAQASDFASFLVPALGFFGLRARRRRSLRR